MTAVQPIFDWLVSGAPGAATAADVVAKLAPELRGAGVPIDRVEAFVRTLHPHIVGRSFEWTPGQPVTVREMSYAWLQSSAFTDGPAARVCATGQPVRLRDHGGYTDYYAGAIRFLSGQVHAITFATRAAGGFTAEHIAAIERILPPLSRVAEILALSRTAANLLNTYVGHDAGERILAGKIQRGDTDSIRAVLWFSDLRGFTQLSATLPPPEIMRVLNDLFDCQVPAIERHAGEVLKFMGDGLLAIFPLGDRATAAVCDDALAASSGAFDALFAQNGRRVLAGAVPIQFGLALHVGDVAYGNIGGSGRLDFTCIGPAVNLASRLEGLTSKLARPVIVSREFAQITTRPMESLGSFELKGVEGATEVFAPGRS